MWFLPLLLVGAIAMAVASRSSRQPIPPSRQLSAPPPPNPSTPSGPSGLPGPISVLGEILRVGQTPPPMVILCAIAEAQSIGPQETGADGVHVDVVGRQVAGHDLCDGDGAGLGDAVGRAG